MGPLSSTINKFICLTQQVEDTAEGRPREWGDIPIFIWVELPILRSESTGESGSRYQEETAG
jgi:hypothetical protein